MTDQERYDVKLALRMYEVAVNERCKAEATVERLRDREAVEYEKLGAVLERIGSTKEST